MQFYSFIIASSFLFDLTSDSEVDKLKVLKSGESG